MSGANETHADIIAEARDKYTVHNCNQCEYRKSCDLNANGFDSDECRGRRQSIMLGFGIEDGYLTELLDRLEAAHRRELLTKSPENVNSGAASDTAGNSAKLREALDYCRDMVADLIHHIGHDEDYLEREMKELVAKCNTALAAPPRNCERFATADDAKREFNYLWNFVWQRGGGCLNERNYEEEFERWLFAHATEKEGGAE